MPVETTLVDISTPIENASAMIKCQASYFYQNAGVAILVFEHNKVQEQEWLIKEFVAGEMRAN